MKLAAKIYTIIYGIVYLHSYIRPGAILNHAHHYFDISITIVTFLGLLYFSINKKLFSEIFWKLWLIIFVIWGISYYFFNMYYYSNDFNSFDKIYISIIYFVMLSPAAYFLYKYSYTKNEIWYINASNKVPQPTPKSGAAEL